MSNFIALIFLSMTFDITYISDINSSSSLVPHVHYDTQFMVETKNDA
jgi:hypothetical protein